MDAIDAPLAKLGHRRALALSVRQFVLAEMCVVGTHWIAMLPETMAKQLAKALPIRLCQPPVSLEPITIL